MATKAELEHALATIRKHVERAEGIMARDHHRPDEYGRDMWAYDFGALSSTVEFIREALDELDPTSLCRVSEP